MITDGPKFIKANFYGYKPINEKIKEMYFDIPYNETGLYYDEDSASSAAVVDKIDSARTKRFEEIGGDNYDIFGRNTVMFLLLGML